MNFDSMFCDEHAAFRLRFPSLFETGRAYVFPCDESGRVDMDALGEHARDSYLYARALVGREYARPVLERCFT
jgi:hypothetical protein